ncbi:hypothetical protein PJP07_30520, partial [Mycobacterium kansasii]
HVPIKLKGKFCTIKPYFMGQNVGQLRKNMFIGCVAEMGILRWMSEKMRTDGARNECILWNLGVPPKMRESRLRWFGHVQ